MMACPPAVCRFLETSRPRRPVFAGLLANVTVARSRGLPRCCRGTARSIGGKVSCRPRRPSAGHGKDSALLPQLQVRLGIPAPHGSLSGGPSRPRNMFRQATRRPPKIEPKSTTGHSSVSTSSCLLREELPHAASKSGKLVRDSQAQDKAVGGVRQPIGRRDAKRRAIRQ